MINLIEVTLNTPLTLTSNSSPVTFDDTKIRTRGATCCNWLQYNEGSPVFKVIEGGVYEIEFTGTVTSATAGIVALGLYEDGTLIPSTVGAETLAAAGDLADITVRNSVKVCCKANSTFSLASIPSVLAGATLVATDTEIPIITSGSLTIKKIYN